MSARSDDLQELVKSGSLKHLREYLEGKRPQADQLAVGLRAALLVASENKAMLLLECGADVELGDHENTRALDYAAMGGNPTLVEAILARNTDVNHTNTTGATALIWAARFGRIDVVQILLKADSNPNTVPMYGRDREGFLSSTVLFMCSVSPGNTGLVQRNSSMPGEPREAESAGRLSTVMRMAMAHVCQPLAIKPPKCVAAPASWERWKGCGSNFVANLIISSSVTG